MTSERKKEIVDKATQINSISERYQLLHATYATEQLIRKDVQATYEAMNSSLSDRIKDCSDNILNELIEEKIQLEAAIKNRRISIGVDYIGITNGKARVVKVNNCFTIYLPRELQDDIKTPQGKRNYEIILAIRKLMAHELGHLVLHTSDLIGDHGTLGSLAIRDAARESEADLFGKTLLDLRRRRNKEINTDGGAHNLM